MSSSKRLYKSSDNKIFYGICGGLGEYLDVDPVIIRLLWILTTIFTGFVPGLIGYIAAALIIPKKV